MNSLLTSEEVNTPCTSKQYAEVDQQKHPVISYDDIASKLLSERLLLTALELHAELCEADKELPVLRDFFSNPNNFECLNIKSEPCWSIARSSSQATLDSLDMTRFSEDGGGVDERVAILEFELRKAKENISSLRANLTVVTESEVSTPDKGLEKHAILDQPIKPHELRALNFLVNEYLLANAYKLTSITFSDENEDQDFEDWQDVGLNIPKPPELIHVYREFMRSTGYDKPPQNTIAVQTDKEEPEYQSEVEALTKLVSEQAEELEKLKQQYLISEQEKLSLQDIIDRTNVTLNAQTDSSNVQAINSSSTTPDKFVMLESPHPEDTSTFVQSHEGEEDDSASVVVSIGETEASDRDWDKVQFTKSDITCIKSNAPSRYLPANFKREVLRHCLIKTPENVQEIIEEPLKSGVSLENLVNIATYVLPRLIPNVSLNKREIIIPLLLGVVKLHPKLEDREKLYQLLFSLQKRPQDDDRQFILAGLTTISKLDKEPSENEEILNLCWEYSQHKYFERRLLAVECCAELALFTTSGVRNSLILSMLQQMLLDDRDSTVRSAVVKSLALLVSLMNDPDKYFQCEELASTALDDISSDVVETACTVFMPILAQWALATNRLQSHLLPRIINKLKSVLKQNSGSPNSFRPDLYIDDNRAVALVNVLTFLLPHTIMSVVDNQNVKEYLRQDLPSQMPTEFENLCTMPIIHPKNFYECDVDIGILYNTFFYTSWDHCTWPELDWISEILIREYVEIIQLTKTSFENILSELFKYLQLLCTGLGKYVTQNKILEYFKPYMDGIEIELSELNNEKKLVNVNLIPAYLTILSTLDSNKFTNALKHYLVALARRGEDLSGLEIMIVKFCQYVNLQEYVLSGLWDGVVYENTRVKCATASILSTIISKVSDKLVEIRIAPAVVTLASDTDNKVKAAAIPVLAKLVTDCETKEVKEKAQASLESILRDPQGVPSEVLIPLVLALAATAPYCPQNYLEGVIATQLTGVAASLLQQNRNVELTNALVEAFSVLLYCNLSSQCIANTISPGLKYLDNLVTQVVPHQKDLIRNLLKEIDSKKDSSNKIEKSSSIGSGLSLSMASVNVGQGVEDMRQRMSKMFHNKANSSSIQSIFKKKSTNAADRNQ